jgi:hypothetical protein
MTRQAAAVVGMLFLAHATAAQFGQQGSKLVGTGAVGHAQQGQSVAISADGNTAIVGGYADNSLVGAAWVFTRSGGVWSPQPTKLVGTGAVRASNQGRSVAISADGNTAIVGGPGDGDGTGAAWVFTRNGGVWSQQGSKLVGTGGFGAPEQGWSVAISADGNTAIVGGPSDQYTQANGYAFWIGAAWVYTRSGEAWSQQGFKLVATDAVGGARLGTSVAISADGNTAVVGGPEDNSRVGAAWVFSRSGVGWSQQGDKLVGTGAVGYARQGTSVAISADGTTAIVGGPDDQVFVTPSYGLSVGAAWAFTRSGGVWTQQGSKLVGTGAAYAAQGWSVAISGNSNTVIIGGPLDYDFAGSPPGPLAPPGYGAAWTFTRSGGVWSQQGNKLAGTDAVDPAWQGSSVAISADGTTAIVGGPRDDSDVGAAWVFSLPTFAAWVPVAAHNPGLNQSQWRSDLGLLNPGSATANVQIEFLGSGGPVTNTTLVPAGAQSILTDVVGQLGASGQGAVEVLADQPLKVTSRTYNQVPSGATCYPNGTQGQDYPALSAGDGLAAGRSAYLAGLTENAEYRCNIGLVNVGSGAATVLVELYNGAGTKLTDYTVSLAAGRWAQETQPFLNKAGQTSMDRGYAKITVQSGSGVFGFASVIDNATNDPTTVAADRSVLRLIQQGGKVSAAGSGVYGSVGGSVAVSADGNTAIVGASGDNGGAGAAWVFTRSGGVWSQQGGKLVGTDAVGAARQGFSVAISADGNTAIVGGRSDSSGTGAAWVFTRRGGAWSQQGSKLVGTNTVYAVQGTSVAISADGNTAIVGGEADNGWAGAAWVFTRDGGVWAQQGDKLVATDAELSYQGHSVAISADGNTAIVGAPGDGAGAAWVFTRSGGVWLPQGDKLVGAGSSGHASQGSSVALSADGNTTVVGGPNDNSGGGAAWVFGRSNGVWAQQGNKLVGIGAVGCAHQGWSVAVSADGSIAIIGGPFACPNTCPSGSFCSLAPGYGAAWVFTSGGGLWSEPGEKLVGTGGVGTPMQGYSVAISADGTTAIVAGPGDADHGAAWVFSVPPFTAWVPVAAHNPGLNQSQWRSDLGLLNSGAVTANVQIEFFGTGGNEANATYVPALTQWILNDVVGQLGVSDQGALEIVADQPLKVTSRTYNQVSPDATCYPNGTQGQNYPTLTAGDGLSAGEEAWLPHLAENTAYRANIGLVNTGPTAATVTVELYDGAGTLLASYPVSLTAGEWKQEIQPFRSKAGQTAMDRGYAKVTVTSGTGVFAFASVVDNITNDPTTITMQR